MIYTVSICFLKPKFSGVSIGVQRVKHPTGILVLVLAAPLPNQLLATVPGKAAGHGPSIWTPPATWETLMALQPGTAPADASISGMNQQVGFLSLSNNNINSIYFKSIITDGKNGGFRTSE